MVVDESWLCSHKIMQSLHELPHPICAELQVQASAKAQSSVHVCCSPARWLYWTYMVGHGDPLPLLHVHAVDVSSAT